MVRYFINYEDLIENNVLGKNITLYSSCLFIKKKQKKGLIKFEPILHLINDNNNVLNFARKLNYNKKGILMVELTSDDVRMFDELLIKKYDVVDKDLCRKVYENKDEIINLIGFKSLINMNENELKKGSIITLMPCVSDKKYLYVSADRGVLAKEYKIIDRRNMLLKESIGSDIYFHTNDEELLERYKNDITLIKEIDFCKYKITNHKLFILDAVNNHDIKGFNGNNYYCLDIISKNATPVYIKKTGDDYELSLNNNLDYNKKGYIINTIHFNNLLTSDLFEPLIKYINVYELIDGIYKKESLENYLNNKKILKYTKKNW